MARPLQHQIIARALEILCDEQRWTRLVIARTADGKPCPCFSPSAVRFCAVGALYRAAQELLDDSEAFPIVFRLQKFVLAANNRPNDSLPRINDAQGREVIVAMFGVALGGEATPGPRAHGNRTGPRRSGVFFYADQNP